jgi:hypothetical protein
MVFSVSQYFVEDDLAEVCPIEEHLLRIASVKTAPVSTTAERTVPVRSAFPFRRERPLPSSYGVW